MLLGPSGKRWLLKGYSFVRNFLQQSKLENVLSIANHIVRKVINVIWLFYNRTIIYC
jgi:hypothetical protein